jgi:hypothetical protein
MQSLALWVAVICASSTTYLTLQEILDQVTYHEEQGELSVAVQMLRSAVDGAEDNLEAWKTLMLRLHTDLVLYYLESRPRKFVVASYGGSGSRMLTNYLKNFGAAVQLHDRLPPVHLTKLTSDITDCRGAQTEKYCFISRFSRQFVPPSTVSNFTIVFVFRDPIEALLSRAWVKPTCNDLNGSDCRGLAHCQHIQGDTCTEVPSPQEYALRRNDTFRLLDHYAAFAHPTLSPNFNLIAVNYHKIWDAWPALMHELGVPASEAAAIPPPKRAEKKRHEQLPAAVLSGFKTLYSDLRSEIAHAPAVRRVSYYHPWRSAAEAALTTAG